MKTWFWTPHDLRFILGCHFGDLDKCCQYSHRHISSFLFNFIVISVCLTVKSRYDSLYPFPHLYFWESHSCLTYCILSPSYRSVGAPTWELQFCLAPPVIAYSIVICCYCWGCSVSRLRGAYWIRWWCHDGSRLFMLMDRITRSA